MPTGIRRRSAGEGRKLSSVSAPAARQRKDDRNHPMLQAASAVGRAARVWLVRSMGMAKLPCSVCLGHPFSRAAAIDPIHMHPPIQTFNIVPKLPPALEPLREIVYNLWWSWEPAARRLFRSLDEELWNGPITIRLRVLQLARQARLEAVARDETFPAGTRPHPSAVQNVHGPPGHLWPSAREGRRRDRARATT